MSREEEVRKVQELEIQELKKKIEEFLNKMEETRYSEEELREMERFHRRITYISPEDLLKPFTI